MKRPAAAVTALAMATLSVPAMADSLVVRSSGPSAKSYPAGKALPDSAKIVLRSGDQVVILDGRGTRTLKGPGTFSPTMASNKPSDSRETFAEASTRRARPGAVRSVGSTSPAPVQTTPSPESVAARTPNIWFVDIERSTTVCVPDPNRVVLWRPEGPAGVSTITGPDGSTEKVAWLKGQTQRPWPAKLPVSEGAEYRVSWDGATMPATSLRFALLGPNPTGLEDMASTLIRKGCNAQLDLLIETVAIPESGENSPG